MTEKNLSFTEAKNAPACYFCGKPAANCVWCGSNAEDHEVRENAIYQTGHVASCARAVFSTDVADEPDTFYTYTERIDHPDDASHSLTIPICLFCLTEHDGPAA